jgi:hypothetical protein
MKKIGMFLFVVLLAGFQTVNANEQMKEALDCLSKLKAPGFSIPVKEGASLYLGKWPAAKICQGILIETQAVTKKIFVTYAYEASGTFSAGFAKTEGSFQTEEKKLTFSPSFKNTPSLSYNLETGDAEFEDKTGKYKGYVFLADGPGFMPFVGK